MKLKLKEIIDDQVNGQSNFDVALKYNGHSSTVQKPKPRSYTPVWMKKMASVERKKEVSVDLGISRINQKL